MTGTNGFSSFLSWGFKALIVGSVAFLVTSTVSFGCFVTITLINLKQANAGFVTTKDVEEIVKKSAPYVEDKAMIMKTISQIESNETQLLEVIDRNTTAINGLNQRMTTIDTILQMLRDEKKDNR